MSLRSKSDTNTELAGGGIGCLLLLVLMAGLSMLFGWPTMLVLSAFGVKVGYWPCVGAWVLLSALFNTAKASLSSKE